MISWRMAAAWLLALVLTTVLTWQIVGLADSQVGEEAPLAVAPLSTTTSSGSSSSSSTAQTSTTIATTSTTAPDGASGSSPSPSPSSTSSVATTVESQWSVRTINSAGGSVVIRHRPGEVEYQAATPAAGFGVEVDDAGPDRVRVEFESEDADIRVEARWENGELNIDVDGD